MHFYPHNIADYRKDTRFLTKLQHWAYRELLDEYYLSEQPITNNEKDLFWRMGATTDEEQQAIKTVLNGFFEQTEDGFIHKRCDVEIQIYKGIAEKRSRAGKASGKSRRGETNTCSTHVQQNEDGVQQTNTQEPIAKKQINTPVGVDASVWNDYLKVRRAKKLPMTETALKGIIAEANKAGKTLNEAITICCENNWVGFKAEWLEKFKKEEVITRFPGK